MVVIQNIINDTNVDEDNLSKVCQDFLNENALEQSELLIRLVSPVEIQVLNKEYRNKNQVTNVLSFQSDIPDEVEESIRGDVVICVDVVREEALVGDKKFAEDAAIVCGIGKILNQSFLVIGNEKGSTMETRIKHNFIITLIQNCLIDLISSFDKEKINFFIFVFVIG